MKMRTLLPVILALAFTRSAMAATPFTITDSGGEQATVTSNRLDTNVSGTVTATGPLTDTQLRATAVPVSGTVTVTDGSGALNVIVDSGSITANAGTNLNTSALALDTSVDGLETLAGTTNTDLGPPGATACATDTGSCSLNALAQRIAQRLTTVNTTLGTPIQATGGTVGLVAGSAVIGHVINDASSAVIGHVIADSGSTTAVTGTVTASATLQTQTDTVMVGGVNVKEINAVTPLMGNGVTGTGSQRVTIASDNTAFSVNAVESGTWTVQPGNTPNTTAWLVQPVPGTTNGLTWYNLEPAASDNHANIKNGAGLVYHVAVTSKDTALNYLRLYNAATGFNGCNSATNLVYAHIIPASATGAGFVDDIPGGITFSTGISICVTGAYGQTTTTSATASAMEVNVGYK